MHTVSCLQSITCLTAWNAFLLHSIHTNPRKTFYPSITHNLLNHLMNQSVHQEEIQHTPHQQLNVIRSFLSRRTHVFFLSSVYPLTLNNAHHYRLCPCYTTCFQSRLRSLYYPCYNVLYKYRNSPFFLVWRCRPFSMRRGGNARLLFFVTEIFSSPRLFIQKFFRILNFSSQKNFKVNIFHNKNFKSEI